MLDGVASRLRHQLQGNKKVQTVLLQGEDVPGEVLSYAAAHEMSLVAMSSRGHSGLGRLVLGSVASRVLEASEIPVFLLKSSEEAKSPEDLGKSFLVPLDGSRLGEAALATVEDLASRLDREVCLIQVVPPVQGVVRTERQVVYPEQQLASQRAFAQDYLRGVESKLTTRGVKASSHVRVGLPADIIVDYAAESKAGFIAMSTHGRSGLGRWVFGSVADKVLHSGGCPVLLVRASGLRKQLAAGAGGTVKVCHNCQRVFRREYFSPEERCPKCGYHIKSCYNCLFHAGARCTTDRPEALDTYPGRFCPAFQFRESKIIWR